VISSMGSSQSSIVRDHKATMLIEAHTSKESGRYPHRLRLDNQRVSYSFCCLYSIPEEEEVCMHLHAVREEPLVVVVVLPGETPLVVELPVHKTTTTTTDVLLQNNTVAAVNSDSTLPNESTELPTEEATNNIVDKEYTVQTPEPCSVLGKKPATPKWNVQNFLLALEHSDQRRFHPRQRGVK
jgi:hypothetical protein